MTQNVVNLQSVISAQSVSRGVGGSCPSPLNSVIVTSAMSQWGQYQWRHRDSEKVHGFPATNPLSVEWGLGRGDDFDYELPMPPMAEIAHQQLITLSGPAPVFAWLYWAHPMGGSIREAQRMAQHLLPYRIPRGYTDMWLAAVSGSVLGVLGGGSEFADASDFFCE